MTNVVAIEEPERAEGWRTMTMERGRRGRTGRKKGGSEGENWGGSS